MLTSDFGHIWKNYYPFVLKISQISFGKVRFLSEMSDNFRKVSTIRQFSDKSNFLVGKALCVWFYIFILFLENSPIIFSYLKQYYEEKYKYISLLLKIVRNMNSWAAIFYPKWQAFIFVSACMFRTHTTVYIAATCSMDCTSVTGQTLRRWRSSKKTCPCICTVYGRYKCIVHYSVFISTQYKFPFSYFVLLKILENFFKRDSSARFFWLFFFHELTPYEPLIHILK
jgi:hypothetical protein